MRGATLQKGLRRPYEEAYFCFVDRPTSEPASRAIHRASDPIRGKSNARSGRPADTVHSLWALCTYPFKCVQSVTTVSTRQYPSVPATTRHHPSPPVTTRHHPSAPVSTRQYPSPPVTTRHHPSPPVTTRHHPSPPVTTRHHPSPPVTTRQHPSAPVSTRHHPSRPATTRQHPSAPVSTRQHPSPPVTTRHHPSPPVTTRQHHSLKGTVGHQLQAQRPVHRTSGRRTRKARRAHSEEGTSRGKRKEDEHHPHTTGPKPRHMSQESERQQATMA